MTLSVVSSQDGPRITVNDMIKDPLRIPTLVLDMSKQGFLGEAIFRDAGITESGVVQYNESTPLYANDDAAIRPEYGEVKVATTSVGEPKVAFSDERALGVVVSDRMVRRMVTDPVTLQLTQVVNTLVKSADNAALSTIFDNQSVNTYTASGAWSNGTTDIRSDINAARETIETASPDGQPETEFAFTANTLIVNKTTKFDLLNSEQFAKPYEGNIADESLQYTGKMPRQIMSLDPLVSSRIPAGKAIVMQRNVAGFRAPEIPLQAGALYRDEPRKSWRSDVQQALAFGLDQPKAVCIINGIDGSAP